ncbi:two component hybrid sensor histidine kinase and regulator [Ameyamaea chiangmaiensis NBRC 103196]|uniref:histidine kinase n=1 Tax=Ameyamaea chiangmaiensis TaxID=442969 RepID=A0A850P5R0_9PROT|nr:response regulator [Ameyamaea chiangmaiensis]MBS4074468.1 response regulator [Ameyamaea chiangmaiensis]NVN39268.1 response regulator [Ameyamaea chiangmaiensis]GBQ72145.1 two component hybrid sensor histidine kinase and regulator [Ameyamaea chiangmaiensis NBRC 103196]
MTARPLVLIVDDESEILVALTDLLEDSFEVLSTTAPARALEILHRNPGIAVIISDQRMPGIPGDVFLTRARALSDAQAILLTGYADIGAVAAALNQGRISFYSHKPWEPDAMLAMVRQAAERFRLEGELRTERMLLGALMANLRSGLSFKDWSGRFVRVNDLAAATFAADPVDCVGHREVDLCAPGQRARVEAAEQRLAANGRDEETFLVPPDEPGAGRWREVTRVQLAGRGRDLDGHENEGVWSVTIDRDVTARVEMEQRLRQAEKMQALGTLSGGIAHDFNNLLTAVIGSLELVGDMVAPDPAVARLLDNATTAAQRGAVLTRRLLNFSRPRDLQIHSVDACALISGMRDLLAQSTVSRPDLDQTPGGGGACVLDLAGVPGAGRLPQVRTDSGQLEMALLNLCINARDAMPGGGTIRIEARAEQVEPDAALKGVAGGGGAATVATLPAGAYVVIAVVDEGLGMSTETAARIFEPFFTTKDIGRGTGLGLSMVYGFVRHCGGDVRVDSAPGRGTRMELWLPAEAACDPVTEPVSSAVTATGAPTGPLHVLVVDDEALVRAVTAGFLMQAGHTVVEAEDGEEALSLIRKGEPFDLVVMDLLMPVMGGVECARRILEERPSQKIIFVTGFADMDTLPDGARVLAKPFTPQALAAALREVAGG